MIRLFLDDLRPSPVDNGPLWTVVRSAEEAKAILATLPVAEASLDHDLGDCDACINGFPPPAYVRVTSTCRHKMTGYDLVKWMAEFGRWPAQKPRVHSANPAGAANMRAAIDRYWTSGIAEANSAEANSADSVETNDASDGASKILI